MEKEGLNLLPACFSIFLPFLALGGFLFFLFIKRLQIVKREEEESKIYFLINMINCTKGEARKILIDHKWDCDNVRSLIKKYRKKKCSSCYHSQSISNNYCEKCKCPFDKVDEFVRNDSVLAENEILCFKCNSVNSYEDDFCHYCKDSLDGRFILQKLSKTTMVKAIEGDSSKVEEVPYKPEELERNWECGIQSLRYIEFLPEHLKLFLLGSSSLTVPYDSILGISVYRENSVVKGSIEGIPVKGVRVKICNIYSAELYFCLIELAEKAFKIQEGTFDFQKTFGEDKKLLFKENFKNLIEMLHSFLPRAELNEGALNLLKVQHSFDLDSKSSDFIN